MRSTRGFVRAALGLAAPSIALMLVATSAAAQGPRSTDKVAAEALFEEGRRLVAAGNVAEACPKFADSQRLDPSPGTLLNLASCYEKAGRTATAWAAYREAASAANAAGRTEYVATAQRHAEALAPKLARLTVQVDRPLGTLQVSRDGVRIDQGAWGVPIPIDTGSHTIEASAPGYKSWASTVNVAQDGAQASITVPVLEILSPSDIGTAVAPPPAPAPTPVTPPPPAPLTIPVEAAHVGSGQRVTGVALGVAGLVGLGLGGVFSVVAKNDYSGSLNHCMASNPGLCDSTGVSQRSTARGFGDAASVAVVVGAAAVAGGLVLWLTAPRTENPQAAARIGLVPTVGGALVEGAFQ
jgi:hypothetical protein